MTLAKRLQRLTLVHFVVLVALVLLVASSCETAASATSTKVRVPVLGQKGFDSPSATGWGTYKPNEFFKTLSRSLLKFSGGHSVFRLLPDRTLRVYQQLV
jgi:hypothetical protein